MKKLRITQTDFMLADRSTNQRIQFSAQCFRKSSAHLLRAEQYRDYLKIIVNSVHSSSLLVRSSMPLWARMI